MAIPTGSGSEVLKRADARGVSNSEVKLIDGANANYIYTVLNVLFCNTAAVDELISMYIYPSANSSNKTELLNGANLLASGTFIWNEKIVLTGTDELCVICASSANVDVTASYILQDWS
jgi:hypothetical protein